MMKVIRVLHVIGRRPTGGIGTFVLNMMQFIDRSKVHFDFLLCSKEPTGQFDEIVKAWGAAVTVLPELKPSNSIKYLKALSSYFKESPQYDIVHIHTPNIAAINLYYAKRHKIPCRIVHSHSTKYSLTRLKSIRNFILELPIRRMATHYVACTEEAGAFLFGEQAVSKGEVFIAKNAIDTKRYLFNPSVRFEVRKELGFTDELLIGSIGRLSEEKNYPFLLKIVQNLILDNPKVRLVIIGDGEKRKELEFLSHQLGLQNFVLFTGVRSDVHRFYSAFDLFILTSHFEGLPLTGIEAQAADLPCVLSDRITREIQLSQRVHFVSLEASVEQWKSVIHAALVPSQERVSNAEDIERGGYDSSLAAKKLSHYYQEIVAVH